jgi:hypothetical protein
MTTATFRRLLTNLLLHAAESGVDVLAIYDELTRAGDRLVADCRCDLIEINDAEDATY